MGHGKRYDYKNLGPKGYEIIDNTTGEVIQTVTEHPWAIITDLNNEEWRAVPEHHANTGTSRTGGKTWGHPGNSRESEAYCSCGWDSTDNGQTYAESISEIREHLKTMEVYTTPLEQTVYAHISPANVLPTQIAAASGKTLGRVQKTLDKLVARGNVAEHEGQYRRTDKWFSWND